METKIQMFVTVWLFIVGLSHVMQSRAWAEFFIRVRELGRAGGFVTAFMQLPIGLLIVVYHPRWNGLAMIVTLLGWAWTFKGTLYFLFPKVALKALGRVSLARSWEFAAAGWVLIVLGSVMTFSLIRT